MNTRISVLILLTLCPSDWLPAEDTVPKTVKPIRLAELANEEIAESSGIAASWRRPNVFWTHNDSGDRPRLFAFDKSGADLGCCDFQNAEAIDWEDMSSFERDGKGWLLVADVGDNGLRRKSYQLYLCEEPAPNVKSVTPRRIEFQYEDGAHNCESVAVDAATATILLCTKVVNTNCDVFQLALPEVPTDDVLKARKIATIPVPIAVAMDISPDGRRAVVLTYGDAFLFMRDAMETWQQAFGRAPQRIPMPLRKQGEAVCFGRDGSAFYLTSEKHPSPLWEVPLKAME